ncbi:MAG: ribosome biogenesis GTPase Der [Bacteroidales bacterium]|nr:ribosome biogenesis GTPase Der [Bacteroidales bacterium]
MGNIIAIVGRPNVGKSTLFNRLTRSRKAIVDGKSGVTRDRHYGRSDWNGHEFMVIDTGGYLSKSDDIFEGEIKKQVITAIDEADIVLFMVDVETGITDPDEALARILRKTDKKVMVVVNKVDSNDRQYDANIFFKLGLGDIYTISSINGSGTGDLLDIIVEELPEANIEEELELPRLAIVGRPNVGKSSLVNALLDQERNIVTPLSGTTRDTIYTRYNKFNHDFYLVDTAGLRKKGKVREDLEFYSVMRAIRAIENADVCLLLIDAQEGFESQDLNILNLIHKNRKGAVILVNKWDLVEKETYTAKQMEDKIREKIAPFQDVPIIFTSALTKLRLQKVLETAMQVYKNRLQKIPTSKLNEILLEAVKAHHPPSFRGHEIKVKYVTQLPTHSPSFALFCNYPEHVKEPYKRYIENRIREHFNFTGVPILIFFRKK